MMHWDGLLVSLQGLQNYLYDKGELARLKIFLAFATLGPDTSVEDIEAVDGVDLGDISGRFPDGAVNEGGGFVHWTGSIQSWTNTTGSPKTVYGWAVYTDEKVISHTFFSEPRTVMAAGEFTFTPRYESTDFIP